MQEKKVQYSIYILWNIYFIISDNITNQITTIIMCIFNKNRLRIYKLGYFPFGGMWNLPMKKLTINVYLYAESEYNNLFFLTNQ